MEQASQRLACSITCSPDRVNHLATIALTNPAGCITPDILKYYTHYTTSGCSDAFSLNLKECGATLVAPHKAVYFAVSLSKEYSQ